MTVTNTIAEADRVVASVKSLYEKEVDNIITLRLVRDDYCFSNGLKSWRCKAQSWTLCSLKVS